MAVRDVAQFLKSSVELFREFPVDTLQSLVDSSRQTMFEPLESVIEFGEEGRFLGVLLEGDAEASVADDSGTRHRLGLLKAGDIFGEMALMTGDRTIADVIGVSRCTALLIPRDTFSTALVTNPTALRYLSKVISARARAGGASDKALTASAVSRSSDPYGLALHSDIPMKLLVINCGSSSLKYQLFDTATSQVLSRGQVERIGTKSILHAVTTGAGVSAKQELGGGDFGTAIRAMVDGLVGGECAVIKSIGDIGAVGHRVVHGGEHFAGPVMITPEVEKTIEELSSLAPLHNPVNLKGIRAARELLPQVPHVAVFDTAFHHTIPAYAYLYALPYELYEQQKVRRYGFHGMSHFYVALKAAEYLKRPFNELEIISCHLGNGASMCAIDHGRSVDTSMGMTPAEGLVMGTRSGDVDAGVLVHLMRTMELDAAKLEELVNRSSGLKGLSGISNDMREVEAAAERGEHRALLALRVYSYRVRKYIGAYAAAMGGADALIFTGGVGQGSAVMRALACQGLSWMGIRVDEQKNRNADGFRQVCDITAEGSAVRVLVVPTDEERMIARETLRTLSTEYISRIIEAQKSVPILVEISAHHVHLSQEHVEQLFGAGHQLTPESELSQPGQYACAEKVNLVGPKGRIERVRVLGPVRKESQVEIAMTEQFKLGVGAPIRESGDLNGTPGCTLEGPAGSVALTKGVICALRHVHMAPEDALRFGLRDKYMVRVRVEGDRELVFGDVLVRVSPNFRLAMHIDTDEGNAANVKTGATAHIEAIQSRG